MAYLIIGLLSIALIILAIYVIKLRSQDREIIALNEEAQRQNEQLDIEINAKQQQISNIRSTIQIQENVLQSITKTAEAMRQSAEERAEENFKARTAALEIEYNNKKNELESNYSALGATYAQKLAEVCDKLEDLKAKQLAYIQAQQREEEKQSNIDYYRMCISTIDQHEVEYLREVEAKLNHKDALDKVIWEVYYKPAYDVLMGHLFDKRTKISGIYKITNIKNGEAYVGQSVDMRERFRQHAKAGLAYNRATNKLYQAMQDYNLENFTFEILEEVPKEKLNERETYWIDFYSTKTYGMNKSVGGA